MRFAQFIHSLVSWLLATLVVCVALAVFYYYQRADEELRLYLENVVAKEFPTHPIKIGSARLIHGEGIRLREVSVMQSSARQDPARAEMAYCDEVVLYCTPNIQELCQGRIRIQRVLLRRLLVKPTRDRQGKWNFADLFSTGAQRDAAIPTIEIEGAQVELRDFAGPQPTQLTLHNVNASIAPSPEQDGHLHVDATVGSEHFQSAQFMATIDPSQPGSWHGHGQILNLQCHKAMRQVLAMQNVSVPPLLDGLHAIAQVRFTAAKGASEARPRFDIEAQIDSGKYEAPRFLAHTISDISIPRMKFTSDGQREQWVLQDVKANYGGSRIHLTASGPSLRLDSDIFVDLSVDNLNITRELVGILPSKQQALWQKYQPLGRVDVKAKSVRRNGNWRTNANATCKDINIQCERFPYPLTRGHGMVWFRQDQDLKIDLWAAPDRTWQSNPIHIVADVLNPGKQFTGEIQVSMLPDTWLPMDSRVHTAAPTAVRKVLEDMAAHGELNFETVLRRTSPNQVGLERNTRINLRNGGLKYKRFPYPLQDVTGQIILTDDEYHFQEFQGFNDSCTIKCKGIWRRGGAGGKSELDLQLSARDIPCDTELRDALPAGPRQIWSDLRPTGTLDHAAISIHHRQGMDKSDIGVVVTQLSRSDNPDGRSLEMKPIWFPLPMDRVTGEFQFNPNGEFSLQNIQAEHGSFQRTVKLRTNGRGIFRQNGSWEIFLDRVIADRVQTTPEFIAALPRNLSDAMKSLKFQGTLFVNAKDVHFAAGTDRTEPIRASWTSTIDVDNGQFVLAGQPVENLFGEVTVSGRRQSECVNFGTATFDTLTYKGVHVTALETPWYMDEQRLVFGEAVRVNGRKTQPAAAEVFGGRAQATGQVGFTDDLGFGLNVSVSDFDMSHPDLRIPSSISGRGDASLSLQGNSQGQHTLRGDGAIRLREANLAKLPAIIQLLNVMRVSRRPDVFTDANINFRIDGPTAYFSNFDLHGESLSLKGQGRMELDRRVYLKFYSLLGGERMYSKWMRPFAKETSERLLQIFVTGTIDNLKVSQEMGPGWKELFPNQTLAGETRVTNAR